jgi:hypothetical protein
MGILRYTCGYETYCAGVEERMSDDSWDDLEKSLRQLLNQVKSNLSASERREVEDFINCNEFDAAMEALVDFLVEKSEPISKQALITARKVANAMNLSGELKRINTLSAGKSG